MRPEAASLQPWASKGAHLDATDRDSDDDHLDSASYEDACEGPYAAGDEFAVLHCGHFDPSVNRAAVLARTPRRKTTRSCGEHSVTLGEVMEELENVKGALRNLVLRLEQVESYPPSARAGRAHRELATAGQAKDVAQGGKEGWQTAGCGCSRRTAMASAALVLFTWRYARASNRQ